MNEIPGCLHGDQLRRLMEGELAATQVTQAEEHLSACEHCRGLFEMEIGNAGWWQEARESLSHGEGEGLVAGPANSAHADVLALLGPTDDPHMLGRIGTYEIVGILGRGGMGVVFKGFDGALNRYVAIKILLPHLAASGAARKRFAREAQAAAAVVHDHVMAIHGVAEWQGVPYLVMPYGRGVSLQRRLNDHGPLEVREILRIGMQTASGLAAAHAQGLVHRDVKPANILLDDGVERVTLTDFGLARAVDDASLTRSGALAGTPQYMSPEQARAKTVDARSDLFSLGSVLYAMCTGRSPFRSDSSYGVLRLISDDEPTSIRELNPEIPEWLCGIVSRLMAKRPEDRYSTASEVAELLERCLSHVQQPTKAPLPAFLKTRATDRRSIVASPRLGVIAMLGTIGLLLGMLLWQGAEPPEISGQWTSDEWGTVVLKANEPGEYEGTFSGLVAAGPIREERPLEFKKDQEPRNYPARTGKIQLKWSQVERRFNGTWEKDDERSGKLSLRLVGKEIRGAWTTDKDAQKESGSPPLADLLWTRSRETQAEEGWRQDDILGDPNKFNGPSHTDSIRKNKSFGWATTGGGPSEPGPTKVNKPFDGATKGDGPSEPESIRENKSSERPPKQEGPPQPESPGKKNPNKLIPRDSIRPEEAKKAEQAIQDKRKQPHPYKIGDLAPQLRVARWTDGKTYSLEDFRGKVIVLELTASWCAPCRAFAPIMKSLSAKYGDRVAWVGVTSAEAIDDDLKQWHDEDKWPPFVGVDETDRENEFGATAKAYGVIGVPQIVVIDASGRISPCDELWVRNPPTAEQEKKILEDISKFLGRKWPPDVSEKVSTKEFSASSKKLEEWRTTRWIDAALARTKPSP